MAISLCNIEWCTQQCVRSSNAGCWITTKSLAPSHQALDPSRASRTCTLNYLTQTTASHHFLSAGQSSKHPLHGNNHHHHHPSASSCSLDWQLEYSLFLLLLAAILVTINWMEPFHQRSERWPTSNNCTIPSLNSRNQYHSDAVRRNLLVVRALNDNQLASPFPTFLQSMPSILSVDLTNNSFVRGGFVLLFVSYS